VQLLDITVDKAQSDIKDTGTASKPPENRLKLAAATGLDMRKITPALNVRGVGGRWHEEGVGKGTRTVGRGGDGAQFL